MLQLASVGRRFGHVEALRNVSLDIAAGDFMALLGPSGCGKSTLLRLIAGLEQPDVGSVTWDAGHAPTQGEIGFVFQDATLLPWASAADNVFLPLRLRGVAREQAAPLVDAALERRIARLCQGTSAAALRWDAHARIDRARPGDTTATAADG
jgi:NitT/TauT family transport system ATP-binding protein